MEVNKKRMEEFLWFLASYRCSNALDEEAISFIEKIKKMRVPHKGEFLKISLDGLEKHRGLLEFLMDKYAEKEDEEEELASASPNNYCESEHMSEAYFADNTSKYLSSFR
uniref:Uncharacterized protein n=1 Tax=Marseillevirus sp. TaxID=2809551 RepID=A0AA96EPM1_9VIRU|nr:hypothetical protein MarFTMF_467 [Marseillevirus sp.]